MGKPTQQQKTDNLQDQIFNEKTKRVSAAIKEILDREGVAFQPYLRVTEAGVAPMMRFVERTPNPTTDANTEAEKSVS